jgi:hypothetical protein
MRSRQAAATKKLYCKRGSCSERGPVEVVRAASQAEREAVFVPGVLKIPQRRLSIEEECHDISTIARVASCTAASIRI